MLSSNPFAIRLLVFSSILAVAESAVAQVPAAPPPVQEVVDANGVDLLTGRFTSVYHGPSIGPAGARFGFTRHFRGGGIWDSYVGAITIDAGKWSVIMDGTTEFFTFSAATGTFTPEENNGATLTVSGGFCDGTYTYTSSDGTVAIFEGGTADYTHTFPQDNCALLSTVTRPNGERVSVEYLYKTETVIHPVWQNGTLVELTSARVKSLISNRGYKLSVTYRENSSLSSPDFFFLPEQVDVSNLIDGDVVGSVSMSHVPVSNGLTTYWMELTDDLGRVTKYRINWENGVTRLLKPGSTADDITVSYSSGRVSSVNNGGVVTDYAYSDATGSLPYIRTTTVTRAGGAQRVVTSDFTNGRVLSDRDELSRTTTYDYDAEGRLSRITAPEGNFVQYTYDARGNITETRLGAKPGSGSADIVTSAGFAATCTNRKTCNKPNWTRDAKGNQTDYTYDPAHGGVSTVTLPAPTSGAVRPQTRYSYTALEARYLNSSGVLAPSGQPIYLLTGVSTCRTQSACTGSADESATVTGYGPTDVENNLWPVTVTSSNGSGALIASETFAYDRTGNLRTVDGPLAGAADTTRMRYDALRRRVGTIGPDPDGSGPRKPLATRNTYSTAGHLITVEKGTVNSQSDADWASFVPFETLSFEYDAAGRRIKSSLSADGTIYAVEQVSYDALGRSECVATRMNPAAFGDLPASACTLGPAGSFGPDRITTVTYSAADEVTKLTEGYGTATAIDVVTRTYTTNGRVKTLADGGGNLTTFEYDGFDRLLKIRYPSPDIPGSSSTTDFEQRTYDANSNVTSVRSRNGQLISFLPDNLNRVAIKDLPGSEDVYFSYDNQGRVLSATYDSQTGPGIDHTYDAFGRLTTRTVFGRTLQYAYDAAGRRTRVTHPDGFYAEYWYNPADELTAITDSTGTTLASYSYDAFGRRNGVARANGASTGYGYDAVSRLETLTQNLSGTGYDSTTTFTHTPSAQLAGRTQSNGATYTYNWQPATGGSVSMLYNGLNQLTQVGSTAVDHDTLGNLETAESTFTYTYDLENRLRAAVAGSATTTLTYDPLGLLNAVTANGATTEFLYDGPNLVAEYNSSGAVLRRYVHGAGMDEPLVWYEGSGTTDRRYLHADERGSIVAVSSNSGAGLDSFTYSPDGESANAANSRFGYTGQVWLEEVGLYYFKSRMYSPKLGRFLQPDAIGYSGGMNLYAYVGGDPINRVDPLGFIPVVTFTYRRPRFYDTLDRDLYFLDRFWDDYEDGEAAFDPAAATQEESWWEKITKPIADARKAICRAPAKSAGFSAEVQAGMLILGGVLSLELGLNTHGQIYLQFTGAAGPGLGAGAAGGLGVTASTSNSMAAGSNIDTGTAVFGGAVKGLGVLGGLNVSNSGGVSFPVPEKVGRVSGSAGLYAGAFVGDYGSWSSASPSILCPQ